MRVYLVGQGEYESYGVTGVYSTLAAAVAAADLTDRGLDITEWEVDGDDGRHAWYGVATRDAYTKPRPGPSWHGDLAADIAAIG